ncbi:MAG: MTH1187 family thiamine-binding protein [Moorella humiferrea]|uniref:Thiamine-binding protein domain-containing protein n=1 Tax=Neomoorella humiferrea TaxID=676965 RepID=A0A2T0AS94_9FIRM|nr:MTH1187 family thiamine-binding protein [Moorella humiferrea]MBE3572201.1 MTH1187 family thiamine-binding protein [Moorella humiferrea]PRR72900.1 hypothetical protein MOHU_13220 [Moorella humiferrea]
MAILEVVIAPLGTGSTSISHYVADVHRLLAATPDIKYQLTPMGTIIEGELDVLFPLLRKLHEIPFDRGALRSMTLIRIDDRRDKELTMEGKVKSVAEKLGCC